MDIWALSTKVRIACLVTGVLMLIPAIHSGYAGFLDRGGIFAIAIGSMLAAASAVLIGTAAAGKVQSPMERGAILILCSSSATLVVGYSCIWAGIAMNPGSNIPGLIGLLGVPFYWLSIPVTFIAMLAWGVSRIMFKSDSV